MDFLILYATAYPPCIARAHLEHRYTQQGIADHLGVHYSTVGQRVPGAWGHNAKPSPG